MSRAALLVSVVDAAVTNVTIGQRTAATIDISSSGLPTMRRQYEYLVPPQCDGVQCPMLVHAHGQYGSIDGWYDSSATEYGFIMVYLQGLGDGGCGTGWNTVVPGQDISGTCTDPDTMSGSCCYDSCKTLDTCTDQHTGCRWATCYDDIAFVQGVLDKMRVTVDHGDVFATGDSNGGMLMHTLMTAMPSAFRAVVPVYGLPLVGQWELGSLGVPDALASTSVFYLHGRSDTVIPADGGLAGGWYYESEREAMRKLASINNCASSTSTWTTPYSSSKGKDKVACVRHDNCPSGTAIAECLYDGGHGAWPQNGNDLLFWFLTQQTKAGMTV